MGAGLCVVTGTDVGGNPEAIFDRTTGVIVPPRDIDALSQAIVQLADDPALRSRFGSAARVGVQSNFTLDACVAGYESLYRGLLSSKQPGEIPGVSRFNTKLSRPTSCCRAESDPYHHVVAHDPVGCWSAMERGCAQNHRLREADRRGELRIDQEDPERPVIPPVT